jgi:hypothetical protein
VNVLFPHTVDLAVAVFLRAYLLDLEEWATAVRQVEANVVSTHVPHGLSVGDEVLLTGCRDMAGVNDRHTVIDVLDEVSFTIDSAIVNGVYGGGGLVLRVTYTTLEQMPWQAYVGDCEMSSVRYIDGVLDADNCRIIPEIGKHCDAVAIFGRNGLMDNWQMMALMVDGTNLQFVTNGQPTHVMWANTPERIFSPMIVGAPVLFQQKDVARHYPCLVHLIDHQLDGKVVLVDGKVLQEVVEAKRFPDGRGYALSLLDAAGSWKRWIDGQFKLNIFRGEIEIHEAL